MDHHHMPHQADAAQAPQYKATSRLLTLIDGLLKAYRDKRKNEHRIEVKVNGKTKFKATVDKNGRLKITQNNLTAEEIQALQNYFKSIPNPPINPKDFDVMVDGNNVLTTNNGEVVNQAQPQQPDAFAESAEPNLARETFEAVEPSNTEPETPRTDANSDSQEEIQTESSTPSTPTDENDTANPDPIRPDSQDDRPIPTQSSEAQPPQSEQLPLPGMTAPRSPEPEPKVSDTGIVPQDYGLGEIITDGAIVASGDRALVAAHGSLEAKRLELNDCVRRGVEPGFSHLNERATVLRAEINRDLPKFSEQLNQSIAQGKYNPKQRSAPGLDRDLPLTQKKQEAQTQSKQRVLAKK
jgi:hypothetical protein